MHDRNDISEFAFKGRVEVCATLDGGQAVAVCQLGEDANVAVIFELDTWMIWEIMSDATILETVSIRVAIEEESCEKVVRVVGVCRERRGDERKRKR